MANAPRFPRSLSVATCLSPSRKLLGVLLLTAALPPHALRGASAVTHTSLVSARPAAAAGDGGQRAPGPDAHREATRLEPGQGLEARLTGGESHFYKVALGPSQYLRLVVEQRGIILSAALADPTEAEVVRTDNPSGAYGPIYVSAISDSGGEYRLEVQSKETWANPGRYAVRIEELRPATEADRARVSAEKAFADGRRLIEDPKATQETRRAALGKFEASLAYWQQVGDRHWVALTEYCVAVAHRSLGDRRAAEKHFDKSLATPLEEYDWRLRASVLNDAGANYLRLGDTERALKLFNDAFQIYQSHQDRRGQASAFNNIGTAHLTAGRYREAAVNFRKALPLRKAENDAGGQAVLLNNLGGVSDRLGEPYAALESYSEALRIWLELERRGALTNPLALPFGYNNVALAHDRLGDWQLALENYEEALKRLQGVAPVEAAKTLDNIGELYAALGDPHAAMEYYDRARTLAEGKDPGAEANVLSHIGQVYVAEGKLAGALAYFERALKLRKSPSEKANTYVNLGSVYVLQNNPRRALESYELALKLSDAAEDQRGRALTLHKMGEAHLMLGAHETALEEFNQALPLWKAVADRRGEAATLHGMALVERERENLAVALKHSRESLGIIESLRTRVASQRLRASYFASQQNQYELYVDLRMKLYRLDESPHHLAAAIEASEQSRARSLIDLLTEARVGIHRGVSAELLAREREAQHRLNEKARAQMELLNRKHSAAEEAELEREVNEAVNEYDSVKARIRASSPGYARLTQPHPLSLRDMQQQLDENTLLLEYILGEEQSYVWLVSNTSVVAAEPLPKRSELEKVALEFYETLTAPAPSPGGAAARNEVGGAHPPPAAALSRMVLGPVADKLGDKRLLVVGDGVLQYIPFGALPAPASATPARPGAAGQTGRRKGVPYLIEEHEIVSLPSMSTLAVLRSEMAGRKAAPLSVAVLADPVFDAGDPRLKMKGDGSPPSGKDPAAGGALPGGTGDVLLRSGLKLIPLPATEKEAQAIRSAVAPNPVKVSLGLEASRDTVTNLQEGKYRVIHFATHGVFNAEHPELSGLVLSMVDAEGRARDGVLRLHDIYNLRLPADLVVLSACSTGLGSIVKGEGLIGLTRGFMYAGSPRVVASLWRVEDLGTSVLMKRFYYQMAKQGHAPAAALRQAQIEMLKGRRWRSPYYWAGFALQGEWRAMR